MECRKKTEVISEFHKKHIRECIELAKSATKKGNHPFGALLVHKEKVILKAENTVITDHDVTQHAELRLVSQASRKFSEDVLKESILYTSTEPCAMCFGALFWAGIQKVVFGCSSKTLGKLAKGSFILFKKNVRLEMKKVSLIGPVLEEEAKKVHEDFWTK